MCKAPPLIGRSSIVETLASGVVSFEPDSWTQIFIKEAAQGQIDEELCPFGLAVSELRPSRPEAQLN